jgi:hypothetical protein
MSYTNQSLVSAFHPNPAATTTATSSPKPAPNRADAKAQTNKTLMTKATMRRAYTTRGI